MTTSRGAFVLAFRVAGESPQAVGPLEVIRADGRYGLVVGVAAGVAAGLAYGARAWTRYHVTVVVNAARKRGPLRFGAFLDWAHQAGLRVSGVAYQFRHRQLQDLLTSPREP
jgi:hypothetical protein